MDNFNQNQADLEKVLTIEERLKELTKALNYASGCLAVQGDRAASKKCDEIIEKFGLQ